MKPIRVLDLRDTHDIGGPGKTILETYRFIDRARFDLHLAVFHRENESTDTPFLREARNYGLPAHVIRSSPYDPRLIVRTAALVKRLGVDIVHAHEAISDVIAWTSRRLHRVPIVTTMHGWIANSPRQRALVEIDKRVARGFDMVLAVSAQIRDQLLEAGVPAKRVRLVHNAIVIDRYQRSGERGFVASLVGRTLPRPMLACIGRLSAEKGHADLLEALAIVKRKGHQVSAVLAGEGPERARLEGLIAALGLADSVFLPGHVDRPQRMLEDADLMVLPSHTEGLPNAALEALAMNVPVLATAVGGTPEVIEDGRSGRLVRPRDPAMMAARIEEFLANREQWAQMAIRGRASVIERFDFKARTRVVEGLYSELASARP